MYMFSRHLIKMLIGLVGMGLFGLVSLFLVHLYEKDQNVSGGGKATVETSTKQATGGVQLKHYR